MGPATTAMVHSESIHMSPTHVSSPTKMTSRLCCSPTKVVVSPPPAVLPCSLRRPAVQTVLPKKPLQSSVASSSQPAASLVGPHRPGPSWGARHTRGPNYINRTVVCHHHHHRHHGRPCPTIARQSIAPARSSIAFASTSRRYH